MRNFKRKLAEWIFACWFAAFLLFLVGGLIAALEKHGLDSAEAASWMQAVGTFAAVAAGGMIAGWQISEAKKQVQLELQRKQAVRDNLKNGIFQTALQAKRLMEEIISGDLIKNRVLDDIASARHLRFKETMTSDAHEIYGILADVALDRLAESELVAPAMYLRQAMTRLKQHVPQMRVDNYWQLKDESRVEMINIRNLINRSLEEMGSHETKTLDYAKGERL